MTTTPKITFYGGIGTIGGTKIAVEEGGYRILFDFGATYSPSEDLIGGRIHARSGDAELRDLVTMGYTPALDGLYRSGAAETLGLEPGRGDRTQIFISHLHLDHMALVHLLADDLPVWMHHDSLRMFRAVAATGEEPVVPVGARGFEWGQVIEVGPIKVTPVAVDHDIPGASALLIQTSAGTVVYTGDLRRHGPHPELVDQFIEAARATHPKILLIEGTRLGEAEFYPDRKPTIPEPEVAGRIVELLQGRQGLALTTLYPRNPLRIENIAKALPAVGRTMVLSPEMAYVYRETGYDLQDLAIYLRAKDQDQLAAGTAPGWLTGLLGPGVKTLDAQAIRADQSRYLLQLFYYDLPELVDIKPQPGSLFVHSNGEPLGRFDPAYELFLRWLEHFQIELASVPSTGHASHEDLISIVEGIGPEILMPIHSRTPERMEVAGQFRVLPELGGIYEVATGKKIG